ncbi:hypothetical protein ACC810_37895, partial [Rhizobium ruizarguesonis]
VDIVQFLLRHVDLPFLRIDLGLERLDLLALSDLLVGRASPSRILEFGNPSPREMPSPPIATKRR